MGVSPVSAWNREDGRDARPTVSAPSEELEKFLIPNRCAQPTFRSWRRVCDRGLRETARIFCAPTVVHIGDYLCHRISIIKRVGC